MSFLKNPEWIEQYAFPQNTLEEVPADAFERINLLLDRLQQGYPVVSIIISAWNEEVAILRTISSLAATVTQHPLEIIVINNNATDRTQETIDRLHIRHCFQPVQGWGPARQMGLEQARGTYILTADADCFYPSCWVDHMMASLTRPGMVCVYGRYSFIGEKGLARWKLALLEYLKNGIAAAREFNRPFLNAYGMSMGFLREEALKVGFVMHKIRGEDGRLCYDLMQHGRVAPVTARAARVWTGARTLRQDGSFSRALTLRILKELKQLRTLLRPLPMHNTKTSTNS